MHRIASVLLMVGLLGPGCFQGDDTTRPDAGQGQDAAVPQCSPGQTQACTCAGGGEGLAACEGEDFGPCVCAGACTASALTASGAASLGDSSIDYQGAEVTSLTRHKLDADAAEDGCIAHVELAVERPGGGCRLSLVFGKYQGAYGGLIEVVLDADSRCPGFPDVDEGVYRSEPAYGAFWYGGPTSVPAREASAVCMTGVTLQMPGAPIRLLRADGARERSLDLSSLSFGGDWFSEGHASEACVEAACVPGLHDGGRGWCIAEGSCAEGFGDGGDGSCVPAGECASGYQDGGQGACLPEGTCEVGFHDGGDGTCVAVGTCLAGYRVGADGLCGLASACPEALVLSASRLEFGSVRVGASGSATFTVTNPAPYDACPVRSLALISGTSPAYALPGGAWSDVVLGPEEAREVRVAFTPTAPGLFSGSVQVTAADAAGTIQLVRLAGRGSDAHLVFDPSPVDFGTAAPGCGIPDRPVTIRNEGSDPFTVAALELVGSSDLRFASLPSLPATLAPGSSLTPTLRYAPSDLGPDTGELRVRLGTGDVFSLQVLGRVEAPAAITETFVVAPAKADILWIVDNSGSMGTYHQDLSSRATAVVGLLAQAGIEYQLGVISTDVAEGGALQTAGWSLEKIVHPALNDPAGHFGENVRLGTMGSGDERGREQALLAITEPARSGPNAGFLRPDASLAMVFVSDENDGSVTTVDYLTAFRNVHGPTWAGRFIASAIVTPPEGCGSGLSPGTHYTNLALATGGSVGSICAPDWLAPMQSLVNAIGPLRRYLLGGSAQAGTVTVEVARPGGTTYVPAGWVVSASGDAVEFPDEVPLPGEQVVVTYLPGC